MKDTERLEHARSYIEMVEKARERLCDSKALEPEESLVATMRWLIAKAEACERVEKLIEIDLPVVLSNWRQGPTTPNGAGFCHGVEYCRNSLKKALK